MSPSKRLFLASGLSLLAALACKKEEDAKAPPPPPLVKVADSVSRDVPIFVEAIGQTRGNEEVEISARVEGFLQTMSFKEGSFVKKGQVLYTIDNQPFRANLAQAQAKLAQSQAELVRKHQDVARYAPLVEKNAVSVQDYETAVAEEKAQQSAVAAARATVDRAQIDLGYTTVTAPTDGIIGVTRVYPGTLVGRGETTLLTQLSKVDPIAVRFAIPEADYLKYARRRQVDLGADAGAAPSGKDAGGVPEAGQGTPFQLFLADGSQHPYPGTLSFVDRNVDASTGTILLEAAFPNPGRLIRPGQYARVRASVALKKDAVLVAQRSVAEAQGISSVAVVKPDDTVEIRTVKPAERVGDLVVIDSGLKPGERVIVEGIQKVRSGIKVKPEAIKLEELSHIDDTASGNAPAPDAGSPDGKADGQAAQAKADAKAP
jgi:membrane fusion protein (multidrug efflux system)